MIQINIKQETKKITSKLKGIAKQIPFATSLAINRTAQKVKLAEEREIIDVFDRPTPFTKNSLFIKPSNKNNLTASVKLKDFSFKGSSAAKYLQAEIAGGERRLKRYEVALRSAGILPSGYFTVPGQAANIDQYGNIARSQIVQLIAYFRANRDVGTSFNSTDKTRGKLARSTNKRYGVSYFVMPKESGTQEGIYLRIHSNFGTAIRPVLIFVDSARYEAIYDFKFVAEKVIKKEYDNEFKRALEDAIRTAK